jgi:hypothetical protein
MLRTPLTHSSSVFSSLKQGITTLSVTRRAEEGGFMM